jgi:uncharacterized membrane protein
MIEVLIRCCAGGGFVITLFFLALQYGIVPSDRTQLPHWCPWNSDICTSILDLPEARIFGIPNLFYALIYYAATLILPLHPFETVFLLVTTFAAVLGVYLTYVLVRRLKISCLLCFTVHTINIVLMFLFFIHASQWHGL